MKFSKIIVGFGAVVLLAIILLLTLGCPPKGAEEIRIGAVLPLTGSSAQYGIWIKEALELYKDEVNANGGINGKHLAIIYEDDQADPRVAANVMQELITLYKVPVVYGSWASSCVLAQAPIAEKAKTVLMGEAISPKIRDAGDYTFRMQPDARYYIQQLVPFVFNNLKVRKVAILYVNNDFGSDQARVFADEFTKLGGKILSSNGYEQSATDFKTDLTKIKSEKPEAVFVPGYTELAVILNQAKELGLAPQFLASVPFENPQIVQAASNAAEGVIYPHHFDPDATNPLSKIYQKAYQKRYGRQSEGFAALAYDGLRIIVDVMKRIGSNATNIKEELYKIKDFPGVTGPTTFDDHGDVIKPIIMKTVKNGAFVAFR